MPQVVNSTTRLFADDCLLYRRISSPEDAIALQTDLTNLEAWEKKWQMDFNPDKCEVLRVTLKRKPIVSNYNIHGKVLQTVPAAKYLGVTIDSKLTFNTHMGNSTITWTRGKTKIQLFNYTNNSNVFIS